jgi:hypothetical protein
MSRSLRFRSSASAYLNRTPGSSPTDAKKYTYSAWIKKAKNATSNQFIYGCGSSGSDETYFGFNSSDAFEYLEYTSSAYQINVSTTAVFRDPSAWYHLVLVLDTTQATSSNRVKLYINGVQQTLSGTFPSLNYATSNVNSTDAQNINRLPTSGGLNFDGYYAEINMVDGQALAATDFGQYDQFSNWTSKKYTGTYGTNGFYLPFSNNSSTGTLGLDFSGNNNTWTTNNFSVTPSYQYTTYTSGSGTYTVPSNVTSIQYLVVAGGGGGGNRAGGGGGAGGLIQGTMAVTPGQTFAYSVGAGGAGGAASSGTNNNGTNGSNSTFGSLTAVGGGAGATPGDGIAGGSGGGAGHGGGPGGAGTLGQGSTGGTGASAFNGAGGGGGAGAVGGDRSGNSGGAGGAGLTWINGTTYAGGGGGGARSDIGGSGGSGGSGGGGSAGSPGANGTANTGGGGGGGNYTGTGQAGGTGGSGVVIVAYATGNSTYDSMTDVPTQWTPYNVTGDVGGIIRGNYCVLNPAQPVSVLGSATYTLITNGNLNVQLVNGSTTDLIVPATFSVTSGTYYYEFKLSATASSSAYHSIGVYNGSQFTGQAQYANSAIYYWELGSVRVNGTFVATGLSTCVANDVIGVALNATSGAISFYKNNTLLYTASSLAYTIYTPLITGDGGAGRSFNGAINFGQYAFTYAPPSGYKSLCTTNLPTPTIQQGNLVMDATLYTGNSGTQSVVNAAPFKPDFVWLKSRSNALNHNLFDSVRGVQTVLASNSTGGDNYAGTGELTAFNSNGFTLVNSGTYQTNQSGYTYVGWSWQAGQGTNTSNTSGSITSTVSVNASAGFSVVTYTGTGANATVGHGLGVTPSMIIVKDRSAATNWAVYHTSLGANSVIFLNATNASTTVSGKWGTPNSTTFGINTAGDLNASGESYVAYCWAEVAGFSKFGSYTGNGSTDGPFVYLGFRPKFVMIKVTSTTSNWFMFDSSRNTYNVVDDYLLANSSAAGATATFLDFTSNGFKLRNAGSGTNGSGDNFIYMAFAEYPFKSALAR